MKRLLLASVFLSAVACRAAQEPIVPVEPLASPAGPGAAESNLTVAADGQVYLSWLERAQDSSVALRFARYDGTAWTAARTIRSGRDFFVNWADFPSLAVHPGGALAVHWLQRQGDGKGYSYDVRIARSTDGGATWSEPFMPHGDRGRSEKGFVTMWPDGDGFGAAWLDGRNADKARPNPRQEMMVYATTFGATGAPAPEQQLDARTCDCCQTSVALTADGPIVAYRDRTEGEIRDIYVTRRVNGAWTAPAPVHADGWEINACPVNGPSLAAEGRHVAIAWYTGAHDTARVNVAFSDDAGATFGPPTVVDEGKPAGRVAAVLLDDGSALVSWLERVGGDSAAVRVRRVAPGAPRGPATTVAASTAARASGFPRMRRAGALVYFAWTEPGTPSAVRVARAPVSAFR
jgi:hypothetical protein